MSWELGHQKLMKCRWGTYLHLLLKTRVEYLLTFPKSGVSQPAPEVTSVTFWERWGDAVGPMRCSAKPASGEVVPHLELPETPELSPPLMIFMRP